MIDISDTDPTMGRKQWVKGCYAQHLKDAMSSWEDKTWVCEQGKGCLFT